MRNLILSERLPLYTQAEWVARTEPALLGLHIAKQGGRFISVLARSRREDLWFHHFVQVHDPPWEEALRRANPRRSQGPEDVWKVVEAELPSREGYRIIWVRNSLMALQDTESRQARIEKAWVGIEQAQGKLTGPRCRYRSREKVAEAAQWIIEQSGAGRWVTLEIEQHAEPAFRQESRGRPGAKTRYRRQERLRFSVSLQAHPEIIDADACSDGMFRLITNTKDLSKAKILEAYTFQPRLEKRHEQLKSVEHVAPVFLKKVGRIETPLFLCFLTLLVQALPEREVRSAMAREQIDMLPLYPEERECLAPSTERILELFAPPQRHRLSDQGRVVKTFEPKLTPSQHRALDTLQRKDHAQSLIDGPHRRRGSPSHTFSQKRLVQSEQVRHVDHRILGKTTFTSWQEDVAGRGGDSGVGSDSGDDHSLNAASIERVCLNDHHRTPIARL